MMTNNGHIKLFERYRNGELSDSELREFEARLIYDSEFKDDFEKYEGLEAEIKNHFRNKLKSKFQEMDKMMDNPARKRIHPKRILIWSSAIAACFLIGVLLLQHFSSNKYAQIAEEYWPDEPGLPVKMSSKGKYDDAMNAYKLDDFSKAAQLLENIQSDTSNYFRGVIAYKTDDSKKAKRCFIQIEKNSVYFHKAQFRLGLILLSEGDVNSPKKIFKTHVEQNSDFSSVSEEILKKI